MNLGANDHGCEDLLFSMDDVFECTPKKHEFIKINQMNQNQTKPCIQRLQKFFKKFTNKPKCRPNFNNLGLTTGKAWASGQNGTNNTNDQNVPKRILIGFTC